MVYQTLRLDYEVRSDGTVQGQGRSSAPAVVGWGCCCGGDGIEEESLMPLCCYPLLHICHVWLKILYDCKQIV